MFAMPEGMPLRRRFYERPCETVARGLLGKRLVHGDRSGVIVETEAYLGEHDLASHARFGRTRRNAVMFGPGGISYVYLCYGMYELFNVVAGRDGAPQAVLIRAVDIAGDPALGRGPGKLTRALGLSRRHNGIDLTDHDALSIQRGWRVAERDIAVGPRIGVDYAGTWARAPLRFWISDHPAVSA
jgi:DNA-3-methyladenine glycosylase